MKSITITIILLICVKIGIAQATQDWLTWYEKSNFLETPRYKETIEFSEKLANASSMLNYTNFGVSPQGRELPLLILDKDGLTSPEAIRSKGRIIVMVQAAIHPGEAEGKDAMFVLFRDIVIKNMHNDFLNNVSVLFIPIMNVDGHERFSPYSRINQNGPKEGGWRTTANNLNLNRDFIKADSPEIQAWLKLFTHWEPDFFIDCHTTDGADYQYPLTYAVNGYSSPKLNEWINKKYITAISKKMKALHQPIFPYVMFRSWFDPRTGLYERMSTPRLSNGYTAVRNRPGLLIETHMLKDYKTRVKATHDMVYESLNWLSETKNELLNQISEADKYTSSKEFRNQDCVLAHTYSPKDSIMVDFLGYEYEVKHSELTGHDWFVYNNNIKKNYSLPYYNTLNPTTSVKLPEAYIVPAEWGNIIEKIKLHGVRYTELKEATELEFETCKFSNTKWSKSPYEGHFIISKTKAEKIIRTKQFEKGSIIIPMNQALSYLIAFMLEPDSEESFLRWGYFNSVFEQKEYVETYVMEAKAREMIKEQPELKRQFEKWKKENPEQTKSQYALLMWFYRQTPYFDSEWNIYPIGRINSEKTLDDFFK